MYILNAFSLSMISTFPASVQVSEIDDATAIKIADQFTSAVGHADTAAVLTDFFGIPVSMNRVSVTLKSGDTALIAQYTGGRLPEGATTLPDGASFKWLLVTVN